MSVMGELRLSIPSELHKALKLKALTLNQTLKQFVLGLLEEGVK